ncbi:MAG: chorismate synthase [Oscillospiraceae bacterium]|nr:chorismate synthase [Oscillospiraceae bacterium]
MKDTFGQSVSLTLTGESHGAGIVAVLSGMAPGIAVDEEFIADQLTKRRPAGAISTSRQEGDKFEILSGVFNGFTTGTPITILIRNENTKSKDYSEIAVTARPGHADYTAQCKYHGFQDYRGGGHFSGRITAGIVAAGAVCTSALARKGIKIGTHIAKCAGISDRAFCDIEAEIDILNEKIFAVLDESAGAKMEEAILAAKNEQDSVGGILETAITGVPAGVGEPYFDSIESQLAHILFSIPAVKGVEFGSGFAMADMRGSEANDAFRIGENGAVFTETNHNGGINGGISNGCPITFRCAIKPTPSISLEQRTIDFAKGENKDFVITGRHDPAIIHRARVVVDSAAAIVLCDILAQRYGTDWLR